MSELEKKLVERFHEALDSASAKKREVDSRVRRANEAFAKDAARFFLESTVQKGNKFYLNCPELTLPGTDFSGIQIGSLFAAGGQHYIFEGKIENFDSIYLAPFYVNLRKYQIRAERGGKIDRVRQEYTAESKDELEYFVKQNEFTTIKNKIVPLLKSKFMEGRCVIRIPNYISSDDSEESEATRLMKDNLNRSAALDGLVDDNWLFSGGRYSNPHGRSIQIVEYVPNIVDPGGVYSKFNLVEIAELTKRALKGLGVLNDLGVVHRDIKPDNLFVSKGKRNFNVKVSDPDLMKITKEGREHGPSSTQTFGWVFKGTPRYSSPEQVTSPDLLDIQSDICSLGLTVYRWWTGYHPIFISESWKKADILGKYEMLVAEEAAKRDNPPVFPTNIESRASYNGTRGFFRSKKEKAFEENFEAILSKMIEPDREIRYKTPEEVIEDINTALEGSRIKVFFNPNKNFRNRRRDISTSKNRPIRDN